MFPLRCIAIRPYVSTWAETKFALAYYGTPQSTPGGTFVVYAEKLVETEVT